MKRLTETGGALCFSIPSNTSQFSFKHTCGFLVDEKMIQLELTGFGDLVA